MAKSKQPQIRQYILRLIGKNAEGIVEKTTEAFQISKSTVYSYLADLKAEGVIEKREGAYRLCGTVHTFTYSIEAGSSLGEDRIYRTDIKPLLADLPENVAKIWRYAFTEMMNNAIEHASAKNILCAVKTDPVKTTVLIADDGVGIFRKIRDFMKMQSGEEIPLAECASFLLAGKFTTAKEGHSGEGIFFTSHMMDEFLIISDEIVFTRNNFRDEQMQLATPYGSTIVQMTLANQTTKTTLEVFNRFSDVEDGFFRTQIPVAHMFPDGGPVSRSEARRLGEILPKFKEAVLDFANVDDVGQAFVHELFVVWQRNHPDIRLKVENACDDVLWMIRRVQATK